MQVQIETRAAIVGVALLALLGGLAACKAPHAAVGTSTAAAPAELRVGIAPNYPPLAFKRHGKITGVEAQFARKLGPALGANVTLVETPFQELIPALAAGRIDVIMSGMSVTDERKKLVSFTHPYLRVGQMLLLRQQDAHRLNTDTALNQPATRIGVVSGTTGEAFARGHFQRAQIKGFDGVDSAVAALRAAQIDVFVHDAPSVWAITAGVDGPERQLVGRYEPLTVEYLAWAVRPGDRLGDRLNAVLRKWNDDGELDAVLKQWIQITRPGMTKPATPAPQH
jgi:polar amino acid transport system substrate-binding protein